MLTDRQKTKDVANVFLRENLFERKNFKEKSFDETKSKRNFCFNLKIFIEPTERGGQSLFENVDTNGDHCVRRRDFTRFI